jgi:CubicO group peptidase (beta-lactamase class C family)
MDDLTAAVDGIADDVRLSGAIRVDLDGVVACERAYGFANRTYGLPNAIDTQFAIASGGKGFTALTVMSLIETGQLSLDTTARSLLGDDLPLIDGRVTVEHLLGNRSGIGDYIDESLDHQSDDYVMPVPVHELDTTEQFVRILDGYPMKFEPGEQFAYCNGGFVVLALIAERAAGVPYHDLVLQRVLDPAGLADTRFLRSDQLPARAAIGYLYDEGLQSNVFHLPVRGNGDGGIYTTLADSHALWDALFGGQVVSPENFAMMTRVHSDPPDESQQYGLGFWVDEATDAVSLHGFDAGATYVSARLRSQGHTYTVFSNTSRGAWPVSERITELLISMS